MTQEDALEYQAKSFEHIPADFSGSILEVPVGTGVISMPVFKTKELISYANTSQKVVYTEAKVERRMNRHISAAKPTCGSPSLRKPAKN